MSTESEIEKLTTKINTHRAERLSDPGALATMQIEDVTEGDLKYHGAALRRIDPIRYAAIQRQMLKTFVQSQMIQGCDFGSVKGIPKPFLFKQGAEKIATLFNFGVTVESVRCVEDFDKPFFHYVYKATVRDRSGFELASCDGSCNSKEKSQQGGSDPYACNSIMKKAEKRAYVGAVLLASNASAFFENPAKESEIYTPDDRPTWSGATIDAEVVSEPRLISAEQRTRFFAIAYEEGHYTKAALKAWLGTLGIESASNIERSQYDLLCKQAAQPGLGQFWNDQVADPAVAIA